MVGRLNGKRVLLTAAGQGIGRASALAILVLLVSGAGLVYITARHISPNLSTLLSLPMEFVVRCCLHSF